MDTISFLVPTTSRKSNFDNVESTPLFNTLLPSLDKTLESDYNYKLYLGLDDSDTFFKKRVSRITTLFEENYSFPLDIHFFSDTQNSPVSVWNHLFKIAYDDGSDFFYQLGDDIEILTEDWSSPFIKSLRQLSFVGVTGPRELNNHRIMTQTFVHRKHYEIFNYYFPHKFDNWFSDDWINRVYGNLNRKKWLKEIEVFNSSASGDEHRRYEISRVSKKEMNQLVNKGTQEVKKYLQQNE